MHSRRDGAAATPMSKEARLLLADLATGGAVGRVGRLVARVDDDAQPEVTDRGAAVGFARVADRGGHRLRANAVHAVTHCGESVLTFGLHELLSGSSCTELVDDHEKKQQRAAPAADRDREKKKNKQQQRAAVAARTDVTTYQGGRSLGIPSPAVLAELACVSLLLIHSE